MKLKVFYDGLCRVCSAEIEVYRKLDSEKKIEFIDICAPGFVPESEGLDPKSVHKLFHIKTKDGRIIAGVDAFAAIWEELPQNMPLVILQKMAKFSPSRALLELGYKAFVLARPFLPRFKEDVKYCNSSPYCDVKTTKNNV
jgi:predicted DCC family thiol-disulfide oxidoreductase YuxK